MRRINNCFCLFVFLILTLCSTHFSFGSSIFFDDFSNDLSKWNFSPGSDSNPSSWSINQGLLVGAVGYGGSSYLYPKLSNNLISDFVFESDIKSISGVDTNIIFRWSPNAQYLVGFRSDDPLWPQDNNNIVLYKYDYGYSIIDSYPSYKFPRIFNLTQNIWHKVKIVVSGRSIKVYYDNELAIDKYDSGTLLGEGQIALQNWGGNYPGLIVNNFDNIRINSDDFSHNKIIFIPGMGGSWNEKAMVLNQNVAQSEWRMTPFVTIYDSMFNGFNVNGLVKNTDYFIYNYDWRKPLINQVADFNNYVNGLGLVNGEKIDICGT